MLLVCALAQSAFFINSANDFALARNASILLLNSDLVLAFLQQITLENVQLDCQSHVIAAETPPFEIVTNVTIRNCVFHLKTGLSADFNNSAMINSTIVTNGSNPVFQRVYGSIIAGMRSSTTKSFAVNATNATIVGCAFHHVYSGADKIPALFDAMNQSTVQNSFFNISVDSRGHDYAAGLAMQCAATQFAGVRAVIQLVAQAERYGNSAAGFIARAFGALSFMNADFLFDMRVSYAFESIGGLLASQSTANLSVSDFSLSATMCINMYDAATAVLVAGQIAGMCAKLQNGVASVQRTSVFVNITRDSPDKFSDVTIAGLAAKAVGTALNMLQCSVFGTIAAPNDAVSAQSVAGVLASCNAQAVLDSCSFSGSIECDVQYGRLVYISGFATVLTDSVLRDCFANAKISLNTSEIYSVYVSLLCAYLTRGNVDSSVAEGQIRVNSASFGPNIAIGGLLVWTFQNVSVRGCTGDISIQFVQVSGKPAIKGIALLFADVTGSAANCSSRGDIVVKAENINSTQSQIAAIAVMASQLKTLADILVVGSITAPEALRPAAGFGAVGASTAISSVLIAVALPGQADANVFYSSQVFATVNGLLVDCGMAGNNASQEHCRSDLKSQTAADALGAGFGWKMEYNDGYPYLLSLPVWDGAKYVLPESGPFSEEFYYVDGLGYPFPSSNYQICRGACYGTYESPLVRSCTNTNNNNNNNNNSYCIQPELAETDFQTASCIQENAHCNSGASICTSEAELKLNQTDSTYSCELGCPGCVNGHCQNNTCMCNLYHSGTNCSTYQCGNDSSACFGDSTMQCAADGSGCVPTDACATLGCVHGSCVVNSSNNKTQCRCDNMWTGSRCDRCNAYGPECSVSQSECNKLCGAHGHCGTPLTTVCTCALGFGGANCGGCAAGHTAVGDRCVCGDSGGPCQLRQTCVDRVCVADCLLADPYCAECELADQSVCARCVKQHTIQNGICQFHLSAAVSTSFAVVLGVAGAVAAALGAVLLFRLLSAKNSGSKQKPVGDGVKLDAVQSGPKSVGKAEKPLLEQIPAIQDVNINIGVDSARDGR